MKVRLVRCSDEKVVGEWDYKGKDECPVMCVCNKCGDNHIIGGTGLKTPEHCEIEKLKVLEYSLSTKMDLLEPKMIQHLLMETRIALRDVQIAVNKLSGKG